MNKLFLLLFSTYFIGSAYARSIPIVFDVFNNEVTISLFEDYELTKPNIVQ